LVWFVGGHLGYVALAVGAALLVALAIAVVRGQRRMRALEQRLARAEQVATGPAEPTRAAATPPPATPASEEEGALVPTPLGSDPEAALSVRVDREMFWDLVLRESVVRIAAVGHGVRAVLDPRTRHRIRFEVRQEIKRARKQRRSDERSAERQLRQDRLEDTA
jgi:heme exporter protein D